VFDDLGMSLLQAVFFADLKEKKNVVNIQCRVEVESQTELEEARRRRGSGGEEEEEKELINVDLPSQTAAREPDLVRRYNLNERNKMKTFSYTDRFFTTPDRVRPPGAEIEEGNLLATDFSLVTDFDAIHFLLDPQTAAREPVFAGGVNGNEISKEIDPHTLSTTSWPTPSIAHERTLTTNLSSLAQSLFDSIDLLVNPQTSSTAPWRTGLAPLTSGLASTSGPYQAQPPRGRHCLHIACRFSLTNAASI
jgi:hypothetical protein